MLWILLWFGVFWSRLLDVLDSAIVYWNNLI